MQANCCCQLVAWFIVSYLWHGLGITLGYHRLLAHRSLVLPTWVAYPVVIGGYLALQGSPVVWVGVHRLHHAKSDTPGDPHSPQDGFLHALAGWMFKMHNLQTNKDLQFLARDVMRDPVYKWLGTRHTADHVVKCLLFSVAFRATILLLFGPVAMAANLLAAVLVFWNAQLINAVCHIRLFGAYRSFPTREHSFNSWLLGIFALGEGWHNNHHAMPKVARHGRRPLEVDATWYAILLLEALGIARRVQR
jgi:sn-1 stearoyl-lipid 9-desaturase